MLLDTVVQRRSAIYHNDRGIQGGDRLVTWTVEGSNLDEVVVDIGVAELGCDGDQVGSKDRSE